MAISAVNIPSAKFALGTAFVQGTAADFAVVPTPVFRAGPRARHQPKRLVLASATPANSEAPAVLPRRHLFTLAATSAALAAATDLFALAPAALAVPFPGSVPAVLNPGKYGSPAEQEALRQLVHGVLDPIIDTDPSRRGNAGALLRLAFHDAFTRDESGGGANGSIRFETRRKPNTSLPAIMWQKLNQASAVINKTRSVPLSNADLYMLAGAQAVEKTGGPKIVVPLGRTDSLTVDPDNLLPERRSGVDELRKGFRVVNFTDKDLVALSGGHTLGLSRGVFPGRALDNTPAKFDNTYFKQVKEKAAVFASDNNLMKDKGTLDYVTQFADDQQAFFDAFTEAYIKMSLIGWTLPA
eukprot:TRINITY_DN22291_c0_g1_i1.p1 TRINITY_DN22291_c0_g1~~TRINITY_DN22291_c0_g1_i1.p1  ORF type:complete len:355 (-),score=60.74 TRINITY_DN22291_c0_g1_i1:535-1599(-)